MSRAVLAVVLVALATMQSAAASEVTHLPSEAVRAAFAKGMPLVETETYKIHASRRERAGMAEVHVLDTDIIHVLEGSATFVTGGRVVDGREVGPDEIRGASIEGGDVRRIVAGDVLVVPCGVPHWFRDVDGPMTYHVVKVTSLDGGVR